ncbi:hypothetical protein VOM14_17820 [Paraburkholderia sp. MPAMCS5]|uniref:hypothetical protein n=1 Tax=Paraburkholderia sp. MPAMCS5 TaxID=3112563 RepID=UPI002E187AE4|nr:hypothetical protein [Paraburkholderia sp. MPAMCS5]
MMSLTVHFIALDAAARTALDRSMRGGVASRCGRFGACAFFGGRAFGRSARRAADEQHRAGCAHCPDAQHNQPLFHFDVPPRAVLFAPRRRAHHVFYNGAPSRLIRARRKRITPGKIPILSAIGARDADRRKRPSRKGFIEVQPSFNFGCTFLLGGVRFANF